MIQQSHYWVYIQRKMKSGSWRDICNPMFIAALLIIAKIWKPSKCPMMKAYLYVGLLSKSNVKYNRSSSPQRVGLDDF